MWNILNTHVVGNFPREDEIFKAKNPISRRSRFQIKTTKNLDKH